MGVYAAVQRLISETVKYGEIAMAYPISTPAAPAPKPTGPAPDWVAVYYTPEVPANLPQPPGLDALDQMYAYYDA